MGQDYNYIRVILLLKKLYGRLIGLKLFSKVFIIYTAILVFVLVALTSAVLQNLDSSAREEANNFSAQVVNDAKSYFNQKTSYIKQIQQLPYLDYGTYSDMLVFLDTSANMDEAFNINGKLTIEKYCRYSSYLDSDMLDMYMLKISDKSLYHYVSSKTALSGGSNLNMDVLIEPSERNLFQPMIFAPNKLVSRKSFEDSDNILSIAANLRDEDVSEITGTILINFSTQKLKNLFNENNKKYALHLIVFSEAGEIIYDSSKEYYGKTYPGFSDIKDKHSGLVKQNGNITSVSVSEEMGIILACTIENEQIYHHTLAARRIILIVLALCIFISITLSYVCMTFFSRRINTVCSAMDQVRTGDLSRRIQAGKSRDEISMIAVNFNHMCDNLNEYIHRVYILGMKQKDTELKQKTAELYALQSQINPHFLYNTLEAIRMKALSLGNEEIGRMIRVLGTIFRNNVRQEMFVKIRNEIDYCKSYLELFSLRYAEQLNYSIEVDPTVYDYGIIKHLLQPLIENFLIHGIDARQKENRISIKCCKTGDNIDILIEDNGTGISKDTLLQLKAQLESDKTADNDSVGITNVNHRIRLIYGEGYGLDINSISGKGTTVHVKIAAFTIKELEQYVQGNVGG